MITTTEGRLVNEGCKRCCKCGEEKPRNEFGKDKHARDGHTYDCKVCRNAAARNRIAQQPGYHARRNAQTREYRADYYRRNFDRLRDLSYRKSFGITLADYNQLLDNQGGVCAVCRKPQRSARNKHLAVDHCHITGKIRGLLCDACNRAIGLLGDDPQTLHSAIQYLQRHAL